MHVHTLRGGIHVGGGMHVDGGIHGAHTGQRYACGWRNTWCTHWTEVCMWMEEYMVHALDRGMHVDGGIHGARTGQRYACGWRNTWCTCTSEGLGPHEVMGDRWR